MRGTALDIEDFDRLLSYLRDKGQVRPNETPRFTPLSGGVSNRTVLVQFPDGRAWVLKQALERLRVPTEWICDRGRIVREALGMEWLGRLAPPGSITPLVFVEEDEHLLAMQAVPEPHTNWKSLLLRGNVRQPHVIQFGVLLASIHRHSQGDAQLAQIFDDRKYFTDLRLEPYYRYTARQVPESQSFFEPLIAQMLDSRQSLVHGDYSPKNVLVYKEQLVLLDHEVIHYGDPAFDVGFALTHLLSKAHHLPACRSEFLGAACEFWKSYSAGAQSLTKATSFEERAVQHTLGCLLARVRGRSPLEYLDDCEKDRQARAVLGLMRRREMGLLELVDGFVQAVN
jgi:aminoglycoside phosphotransferase (APT) family kinase protein